MSKKSNSKMSAHPDLAANLLQILIPTTFSSPLCQKGQFTVQLHVLEDGLLGNYLVITLKKSKQKELHRKFCLSRKEIVGNCL